jgi:ABC-2 type transport system ATP-binding protein
MQIELQQVTKVLGGYKVLDEIDLTLASGQVVSILGANGAGKTTLIHLLAGLYLPTSGRVLLNEQVLTRRCTDLTRKLHFLTDFSPIPLNHSPIQYILSATEMYGVNNKKADERIVDLLAEFDLLTIADLPSRSLSRGQRYKATLVALLVIDPEIWILDEPFTSGMDPLGLNSLRRHVRVARDRGRLIVFSTQLVELARELADRVCVLADSKIAAFDVPSALQQSDKHSPGLNALLQQLSEVRNV